MNETKQSNSVRRRASTARTDTPGPDTLYALSNFSAVNSMGALGTASASMKHVLSKEKSRSEKENNKQKI